MESSYPSRLRGPWLHATHSPTPQSHHLPHMAPFAHTNHTRMPSQGDENLDVCRPELSHHAHAKILPSCQDSPEPGQGSRHNTAQRGPTTWPPVFHALISKCRRGLRSQTLCVPNKRFLLNLRRRMTPSRHLSPSWPGEDPKPQWFGGHHDLPRHRPFRFSLVDGTNMSVEALMDRAGGAGLDCGNFR